nr:MAG TPA_asm: hypothetical protein [Caudoviricetes sp.]
MYFFHTHSHPFLRLASIPIFYRGKRAFVNQ